MYGRVMLANPNHPMRSALESLLVRSGAALPETLAVQRAEPADAVQPVAVQQAPPGLSTKPVALQQAPPSISAEPVATQQAPPSIRAEPSQHPCRASCNAASPSQQSQLQRSKPFPASAQSQLPHSNCPHCSKLQCTSRQSQVQRSKLPHASRQSQLPRSKLHQAPHQSILSLWPFATRSHTLQPGRVWGVALCDKGRGRNWQRRGSGLDCDVLSLVTLVQCSAQAQTMLGAEERSRHSSQCLSQVPAEWSRCWSPRCGSSISQNQGGNGPGLGSIRLLRQGSGPFQQ